ncbi:MAG: Bor/Iss family lipoprotein [Longimicrobiales bacterium]
MLPRYGEHRSYAVWQSIKQPWAMSFIYGLVPPKTMETAQQCPDGVAKVDTQLSFLNGLVAALTFQNRHAHDD